MKQLFGEFRISAHFILLDRNRFQTSSTHKTPNTNCHKYTCVVHLKANWGQVVQKKQRAIICGNV